MTSYNILNLLYDKNIFPINITHDIVKSNILVQKIVQDCDYNFLGV